mmetsp:Transcript_10750/g.24540  ORF Transcript_10750/g.24540 Transcript_10750/m.24540 type:complete len:290 (-) Transcript_10750:157-1026(-)|eukprot:CAMPEP_0178445598 /NCGR_PEP_ID=MMETSP0689_2-20121128/40274_1 /TAXON_ID=160604 /ORGANISM="Amphidinium massartii, Strain CS-259" /LENGTH=289 /DNA_ID=CAMNT_0020070203 /DNA_START=104 /DNA_END=973 /DNA_ORIENTATION=-
MPATKTASAAVPPVPAARQERPQWNGSFRSQLRNTALCRYAAKGKCRYGSQCMFAHSVEQLNTLPDLAKTSLCKAWAAGHCPLSSKECQYAHGRGELRRTPAFQRKSANQSQQNHQNSCTINDDIIDDAASCSGGSNSTLSELPSGSLTPVTHPDSEQEEATEEEQHADAQDSWSEVSAAPDCSELLGFETDDEFESPWTSEAPALPKVMEQMPQMQMQPFAAASPLGCYSGNGAIPFAAPLWPLDSQACVTFVPVLVAPAAAAPPTAVASPASPALSGAEEAVHQVSA